MPIFCKHFNTSRHLRRVGAFMLSATLIFSTPSLSSAEVAPPDKNTPTDTHVIADLTPPVEMEQRTKCSITGVLPNSDLSHNAPASNLLNLPHLHQFATGKNVTVAIIDSGVTPNRRLKAKGLGDTISGTDGLRDCDNHGTIIAGIIGAQPSPNDGLVGIAPDVKILSIRQTSEAYSPKNSEQPTQSLKTMAQSIVAATKAGADIINLSVTACAPVSEGVGIKRIATALKYAYNKGTLVVTAVGNANSDCKQNPMTSEQGNRGWDTVQTISYPAYYAPTEWVMAVGGTNMRGQPYSDTFYAPYVTLAAPAAGIVSFNNEGKVTNAEYNSNGEPQPIAGTSFSAAYVTGVAALLKEQHPDWGPQEISRQLIYSSTPLSGGAYSNWAGFGVLNAEVALTEKFPLDKNPWHDILASQEKITLPKQAPRPEWVILIILGLIGAAALIISFTRKDTK